LIRRLQKDGELSSIELSRYKEFVDFNILQRVRTWENMSDDQKNILFKVAIAKTGRQRDDTIVFTNPLDDSIMDLQSDKFNELRQTFNNSATDISIRQLDNSIKTLLSKVGIEEFTPPPMASSAESTSFDRIVRNG